MKPDLASLIAARMCHDLISPLGAIGNGVELLSMSGAQSGPEMDLINDSVENANARIRFFRIAYGGASDSQTVARAEILSTLEAMARGGRFRYHWQADGDPSRVQARIAFLAIQCVESALPLGGDITITQSGTAWQLTAQGARLNIDDALWVGLTGTGHHDGQQHSYSAAQVQFALLPQVTGDAGRQLLVAMGEDTITITF